MASMLRAGGTQDPFATMLNDNPVGGSTPIVGDQSAAGSGLGAVPVGAAGSGLGAVPVGAAGSGLGAVPVGAAGSGLGAVPVGAAGSGLGAVPVGAAGSGLGAVPVGAAGPSLPVASSALPPTATSLQGVMGLSSTSVTSELQGLGARAGSLNPGLPDSLGASGSPQSSTPT